MQNGSVTVGTSATEILPNSKAVLTQGVQLKAAAANTGAIHIGNASNVSFAGSNDGFELAAGQGLFVPLKNASNIFAIATAAGQKLYYLAV